MTTPIRSDRLGSPLTSGDGPPHEEREGSASDDRFRAAAMSGGRMTARQIPREAGGYPPA
jgi:hypothetical protein